MVRSCQFEHDANLCASGETKCQKDYGANQFSMRKTYQNSYRYRLSNPPQVLLKVRRDNIAIIPASMLPFKGIIQEHLSKLPHGAVFLGFIKENTRQQKVLDQVGAVFQQHGHAVTKRSM